MEFSTKARACFWLAEGGEEAVAFWTSLLPDSRVENLVFHDPSAPPVVIEFTVAGTPMMILQAPGAPALDAAASISVLTDDQAETDRLWNALAEGGAPGVCGWITDRFGLWWQIVPKRMPELLASPDAAAAMRVSAAMMRMQKIDIAALEAAHANP